MSMSFLSQLQWRHAAKSFDTNKPVSESDLEKILEAIQMAPSSYGLQPYHVYIIQNKELQAKIQKVSWNQPQVSQSSHVMIFCSRTDVAEKRINEYFEIASGGSEEIKEKMKGYKEMMEGGIGSKSDQEQKTWADRQTYIALGFAMAAAAELEVDSCPMEGFDPQAMDELLELPDHLHSVVMLPLGHREEDPTRDKVRFPQEELFSWKK